MLLVTSTMAVFTQTPPYLYEVQAGVDVMLHDENNKMRVRLLDAIVQHPDKHVRVVLELHHKLLFLLHDLLFRRVHAGETRMHGTSLCSFNRRGPFPITSTMVTDAAYLTTVPYVTSGGEGSNDASLLHLLRINTATVPSTTFSAQMPTVTKSTCS